MHYCCTYINHSVEGVPSHNDYWIMRNIGCCGGGPVEGLGSMTPIKGNRKPDVRKCDAR